MESLKRLEDIQVPDERNLYYSSPTREGRITIEDRFAQISAITPNSTAPEDVRSYFATLQNICLYAWFSYDFYAVVVFLSFTLVEMALKLRFPIKGKDTRTLKPLLEKAIRSKLISEKSFSHIRRIRQQRAEELWLYRKLDAIKKSSLPKNDYMRILVKSLPKLRNALAHPRGHAINLPAEAIFNLQFAADFINQIFPQAQAPKSRT